MSALEATATPGRATTPPSIAEAGFGARPLMYGSGRVELDAPRPPREIHIPMAADSGPTFRRGSAARPVTLILARLDVPGPCHRSSFV